MLHPASSTNQVRWSHFVVGWLSLLLIPSFAQASLSKTEQSSHLKTNTPCTALHCKTSAKKKKAFKQSSVMDLDTQEYIVQKGDTFWDISRRLLGSPWYWPKLWTKNPHIQNPHWIFPGTKLLIQQRKVVLKKKHPLEPWITKNSDYITNKHKLKNHWKLGQSTYLVVRRESFLDKRSYDSSGIITASKTPRSLYSQGDIVYIRFPKAQKLLSGQKLSIFSKVSTIRDVKNKKQLGHHIRLYGVCEVIQQKKGLTSVKITKVFREIKKGFRITRWIPNRVKVKPQKTEHSIKGRILQTTTAHSMASQFTQVFINKGLRHGVKSGQVFEIKRRKKGSKSFSKKLGRLVIIDARLDSAVALVTRSSSEINKGDQIQSIVQK